MERAPHYLRFARALALLTGLAGIPACTETGEVVADGGPACANEGSAERRPNDGTALFDPLGHQASPF